VQARTAEKGQFRASWETGICSNGRASGGLFRRPAYFLDALILARRSHPINFWLATHGGRLASLRI
jgi:hypothetical protein